MFPNEEPEEVVSSRDGIVTIAWCFSLIHFQCFHRTKTLIIIEFWKEKTDAMMS